MARSKKNITPKAEYKIFSQRLTELMGDITQNTLADYLGVTRQAVSQWRDGQTSPDIFTLGKLADYFDVSTDFLLGKSEVRSSDISIKEICDKTGLGEDNVNNLILFQEERKLKLKLYEIDKEEYALRYGDNKPCVIEALDFFLSELFYTDILLRVSDFLYFVKKNSLKRLDLCGLGDDKLDLYDSFPFIEKELQKRGLRVLSMFEMVKMSKNTLESKLLSFVSHLEHAQLNDAAVESYRMKRFSNIAFRKECNDDLKDLVEKTIERKTNET